MKKWFYIKLILFILLLGGSLAVWQYLPEQVPSHWNFEGVPDRYWSKIYAVFVAPGIYLAMWLLFAVLPKLDPKKEKYQLFIDAWNILQLVFLIFFIYLQAIMFAYVLIPDLNFTKLMLIGLGVLFIIIGNYMGKIKQNYFIGVKTPWTLNDVDNWNKTQRMGAWMFVVSGLIFLLEAFYQWQLISATIVLILLMVGVPFVYSYYLYRYSGK